MVSPLAPTAHAERAHETGVGNPRRHGEVHEVQRTAEAMPEAGSSPGSSAQACWSMPDPRGYAGLLSAIKPNCPTVKCGSLTLARPCAAARRSSPGDVQQPPSCKEGTSSSVFEHESTSSSSSSKAGCTYIHEYPFSVNFAFFFIVDWSKKIKSLFPANDLEMKKKQFLRVSIWQSYPLLRITTYVRHQDILTRTCRRDGPYSHAYTKYHIPCRRSR